MRVVLARLTTQVDLDIMDIMDIETLMPLISQNLLTGELKVLLTQLRTKDNVDHAGLSLPFKLWRELISIRTKN